MDNRRTIPGYKFYVDPATGERPAVYVTFLCIWPEPARASRASCSRSTTRPRPLDRRERNYDRRDVSAHVDARRPGSGPYLASDAGRERFAAGHAAGTAVVSEEYLAAVPDVEPPELPVLPLLRRDVGA